MSVGLRAICYSPQGLPRSHLQPGETLQTHRAWLFIVAEVHYLTLPSSRNSYLR